MKKIALLVTMFAGLATLQSCTIEEYYEEPSQVFEVAGDIDVIVDDYSNSATWQFQPPIYGSDNVLVYRNQGNSWALVPVTYGLSTQGDEIRYDYDFTRYDVKIYVTTNFHFDKLSNSEKREFVYNQLFRVVVVPGAYKQKINYSDYNATIKALGLENTPVKTLTLKK